MAGKRKDILWKSMIEEFPEEFIRFFYQQEIAYDAASGIEFLDKELEQLAPDRKFMQDSGTADKLLKFSVVYPIPDWLLLLVEIQGYPEPAFPSRLFRYFYRLIDKYGHRVLVLVIYTDTRKGYQPSVAEYELGSTRNQFIFKTYKVLDQQESSLEENENLFSLVILTVLYSLLHASKKNDEQLLNYKIKLLNNLRKRSLNPLQQSKLLTFIRLYSNFENPLMNGKFEQAVDLIIGKTKDMGIIEYAIQEAALEAHEKGIEQGMEQGMERGIEKGRKQGIEEGMKKGIIQGMEKGMVEQKIILVRSMLVKTNLTPDQIADIAECPLDFVNSVHKQLQG